MMCKETQKRHRRSGFRGHGTEWGRAYLEREGVRVHTHVLRELSSSAPAHRAVETASPLEKATLARSSGPVTTEATTRGE